MTRFSPLDFSLLSPDLRGVVLLNCTSKLEKEQKIQWGASSGDGAPKLQISVPCRGRTCSFSLNSRVTISRGKIAEGCKCWSSTWASPILVTFFFPYSPPPPPTPTTPPRVPPEKLDFGPFRLRFGSVSALFRVCFGSVSGLFRVRFGVLGGVGVRSGRGASVREKNITIQFNLSWAHLNKDLEFTPCGWCTVWEHT